MSKERFEVEFPIHWNVWHNEFEVLDRVLKTKEHDIEKIDPRGRTALHLAVSLGHLESVRVLLRHGANANAENAKYWTVVQEAVGTGDPELLQLVLQHRDYQRYSTRTEGVPALLAKLKEAPDFYVEMKWEFTSWVPLVSRVCPSDTYKVYKQGSNVRIDTTLLGFDNMNWQRGSRSYVFKGEVEQAVTMEIDHDTQQVYSETIRVAPEPRDASWMVPSEDQVAARLTSPIVTTYIDTDKISFERSKSGIWGWRSDKAETINARECKVFSASNVELVTKSRVEHMTDHEKQQSKKSGARHPLQSILGMAEKEHGKAVAEGAAAANGEEMNISYNPSHITPEEYFDSRVQLGERDIGRPIEQSTKIQKFKAQLWLCEDYPLSLQEQVLPIIDLMAVSNAHFRKLKDFITLQLPAGFPVKIEIPLFHVLNARITFGNIFALDRAVSGVTSLAEDSRTSCAVDPSVFEAPPTYSVIGSLGGEQSHRLRDEDDQILQFAIQQSLIEAGSENDQVTVWEALNKQSQLPGNNTGSSNRNARIPARILKSEEDRQLQLVLEASLLENPGVLPPTLPPLSSPTSGNENQNGGDDENQDGGGGGGTGNSDRNHGLHRTTPLPTMSRVDERTGSDMDNDLQLALELSQMSMAEDENRRKQEEERAKREEDELAQILALSMTEK